MQTFEWNFTQLLNDTVFTLTPTFVEICLKMTNLYRFITKNLHFAALFCNFVYNVHTDTVLVGVRYSFKFKLMSTDLSTE